jgi:hypothetical protein
MTTDTRHCNDHEVMGNAASSEASLLVTKRRGGIWNFDNFSWMFADSDRSFALFAGELSAIKLAQLFLVSLLFIAWIYLKPENLETESLIAENISTLKHY